MFEILEIYFARRASSVNIDWRGSKSEIYFEVLFCK